MECGAPQAPLSRCNPIVHSFGNTHGHVRAQHCCAPTVRTYSAPRFAFSEVPRAQRAQSNIIVLDRSINFAHPLTVIASPSSHVGLLADRRKRSLRPVHARKKVLHIMRLVEQRRPRLLGSFPIRAVPSSMDRRMPGVSVRACVLISSRPPLPAISAPCAAASSRSAPSRCPIAFIEIRTSSAPRILQRLVDLDERCHRAHRFAERTNADRMELPSFTASCTPGRNLPLRRLNVAPPEP